MERRAFLTGLLGVAGAAAFAGAAQAIPLVHKLEDLPGIGIDDVSDAMSGGTAPDGTPVDKAQYRHDRHRHHRGRHHRRGPRWRTVCRNYRHRGRWVRRCHRVRVW